MIWIIVCIILCMGVLLYFIFKENPAALVTPFLFGLNTNKEEYTEPIVLENFITKKEANEIIKLSRPHMKNATIRGYETVKGVRDSKTAWLNKRSDPIIKKMFLKASNITNKDMDDMENLQVIHYKPSQFFKTHYDQSHNNKKWNLHELEKHGGPRLYTILIYLNDTYEGGETSFPKLNKSFKLKTGDAILFHNLDNRQLQVHENALHEGKPIKKGEKWLATIWVRNIKK